MGCKNKSWILCTILVLVVACSKEHAPQEPDEGPKLVATAVIQDIFEGRSLVVVGNENLNFMVSFYAEAADGTTLEFIPVDNLLPVVMEDNEGTRWDFFGEAIEGPRKGEFLEPTQSCMGFWFSFGALYPGVEIFEGTTNSPDIEFKKTSGWLVPKEYVYQGAGFDAIKSLEYPEFEKFDFRNFPDGSYYLKDDDLVVGVKVGNDIRAYPHKILDYHEVINDKINGKDVSVIYCPLTGTATIWEQQFDLAKSKFGVSGFLFSSNIVPFDRHSQSLWSQLEGKCFNGQLIGAKVKQYPAVETTWSTWQKIYNLPLVVSQNTKVNRDYTEYPYGDYRTNHDRIFYPIIYDDDRLPRKERVHGIIINSKAKVYRFSSLK